MFLYINCALDECRVAPKEVLLEWGMDVPVSKASSRRSSSAGCLIFHEVSGSDRKSAIECSFNMSMSEPMYRGTKHSRPLSKMFRRISSVCTSFFMLRYRLTRRLLRYCSVERSCGQSMTLVTAGHNRPD